MTEKPLCSLIVINYNGREILPKCLDSIYSQSYKNFEVIVVDNGSSDGSSELVRAKYPEVKLILLKKNYGYARATNLALKHSKGEVILILNNDVILFQKFLENAIKVILKPKYKDYKIFSGIQLPVQNTNTVWDLMCYCRVGLYDYGYWKSEVIESLFCSGACLIIYKDWIESLGYLFDDSFFMFSEDLDLSLRSAFLGGKIGYIRSAKLFHVYGTTWKKQKLKVERMITCNDLLTFYKNFSTRYFLKILMVRITYTFLASLLSFDSAFLKEGLFGFILFLKKVPEFKQKRRVCLSIRKLKDEHVISMFKSKNKFSHKILKVILS
jgi:hypothetical protein